MNPTAICRRAACLTVCLLMLPAAAETAQPVDEAYCGRAWRDMLELTVLAESCRPVRAPDNHPMWEGILGLNKAVERCENEMGGEAKNRQYRALEAHFRNHPLNSEGGRPQAKEAYCAESSAHIDRIIKPYMPRR